ncbi:hypothetical protein B7494_g3849 [Chlorociboria aeruginascens]|nr:hypothetical protein B7494_g3849 [Chlorociboria aeruginascens]
MSQEDYPIDFVLGGIDLVMFSKPKVLLFDIGGVCVVSPFQAILDYELSKNIPPGWINLCISESKPNGFWHRLERGEVELDATWFQGFNSDLRNFALWKPFYASQREKLQLPEETPPLPDVDGEKVFWDMMHASREPDPWMFPALKKLKASGNYLLAALSNTIIFPPGHPYNDMRNQVKELFDVFISSAHVGMRKPNADIYEYTVAKLSRFAKENASRKGNGWGEGIRPSDIVFLDDIGENLKEARKAGFRTIKVNLGRTYEAVDALQELTGLELAGDHPRIAVKPKAKL